MLTTIILHIDPLTCIHLAFSWQAQKLFAGLSFRLSEHFTPSSKQSLKELVITAGGVVLEEDILIPQDPFAIEFPALCFIYNEEPPQEYDPRGLAKVKDERCEEAIDFFKKTGAQVRGHTRVLDAIAALDIRYLLMLQCLVQKHRRRRPLQWPPWKPSVLQTFAQLLARKQSPLNLWLADSHVGSLVCTTQKPVRAHWRSPTPQMSVLCSGGSSALCLGSLRTRLDDENLHSRSRFNHFRVC
ncbi:hypothetical protein BHE74_00044521 [Ensete ventricosum]|nr:hypothetical protein BHE74_00044521 [Ensete ventricosum]